MLAVSVLLVLAGSACSGDDGADEPRSDDPDEASAGPFSIAEALDDLPAAGGEGVAVISVADVRAVSAAVGVDVPGTTAPGDREWLVAVTGTDPDAAAVLVPPASVQSIDHTAYAEAAGFSWTQADWFASVSLPPDDFTVLHGEVADAELDTATSLGEDLWTIGDGEDYEADLAGDTSLDQLGRPVRVARSGSALAVSLSTPQAQSWLDGSGDRWGADDSLGAIAQGLDDAEAISAYLISAPATGEPGAVGVGWLGDRRVVIVYDAVDPATAQDRAPAIERAFATGNAPSTSRPYTDLLTVTDVVAEDRTITVTAELVGPATVPLQMLQRSDLPPVG